MNGNKAVFCTETGLLSLNEFAIWYEESEKGDYKLYIEGVVKRVIVITCAKESDCKKIIEEIRDDLYRGCEFILIDKILKEVNDRK